MLDPFKLPRRFLRNEMVNRSFPTSQEPLRIWTGLLVKEPDAIHLDIEEDSYSAMWHLRGEQLYSDVEVGEVRARAGDLICRLPNRRHSTIPVAGSGTVEFFLHLDGAWFRRLASLGTVPDRPYGHFGWDPGLADRCLSFLERLPRMPEASWPIALAEAQTLLAEFAVGGARSRGPDVAMDEACAILATDLSGRFKLAEVARRIGIGEEAFRKRFTAMTGQSPGAWRIHRRIDAACAHLLTGNKSLVEVAEEFGYADVPTFVKQFHRVTGLTPMTWRRGRR